MTINKLLIKKKIIGNQWLFYISPAALFLIVSSVFSLIYALTISFFKRRGTSVLFVGFENYIEIFNSRTFYFAIRNSFTFTILSVIFHILIGLFIATKLDKIIRGKDVYRALQIIPWLIPPVVASCIWLVIFRGDIGLINNILIRVGLDGIRQDWLGNPKYALIAVTITNIWEGYPFATLMILAGLQNIPKGIYESASVDGASESTKFFKITIPLIRPIIATVALLDGIWTFRFFDMVWIMTKGGPGIATEILPTLVFKTAFYEMDFNKAAAIGTIMVIFMALLSVFFLRIYTRESEY